MSFVEAIAENHGVPVSNLLVQYLVRKTRAADRGSKARRSLGNVYALFVLAEDYRDGKTSRFTDLLARMRMLPFGSKLQNHPLDNRLNDEFARQLRVDGDLLPVRGAKVGGQKARAISEQLLSHGGADPKRVASVIIDAVNAYIDLITANQSSVLEEIQGIETLEDLFRFFTAAFAPNADARLFEIASYVLLAEHYRGQTIFIGPRAESVEPKPLVLFRTGRTNANDGGIDFVLQPLGRFFQVTETLDFKKYFLDFEKVNRYPMSFVIKVNTEKETVMSRIYHDALHSGQYNVDTVLMYMDLFEEIFTLRDLQAVAAGLSVATLERIKHELALQFQLEYGLLG
ncbi:hypothetical protein ACNFIC_03670 [Pseudomonas sp. NY15463]|uniref:hypothetical protein n=1 Tax=Pseudomonas sp. NY15463 TaxID=3400361 RepID=UPI003A866871